MTVSYKLNEPDVTAKVMDGEAVIIHLGTGVYYSMDGVGCAVWESIVSGGDPGAVAGVLSERYGIARDTAAADVARLVEELVAQDLVVPVGGAAGQAAALDAGAPATYEPPVLKRYDDMAELLALDPPLPAAPR